MNGIPDLSALPAGVVVALGVAVLVIVVLDVVALVSLARRPREKVAFGNKWLWVAVIVLVNVVGAVLYFAIGRVRVQPAAEPASTGVTAAERASVADSLYGSAPKDTP